MNIPGYKIFRKIGEGAMASVYLAVQTSLGRQVALKVLAPALAAQKGFTARFLNEGRIIAYLKHPQIVDIYDLGSHKHNYFLAMELLSGGTLAQRIKEGIGILRSVRIVKQIATALGFAHQQGVIHRDVKPQNILFRDDGLPVLTDFGIARLIDGGPQLTIPGRTLGSPLYMSPEQINGQRIDARADLYALGVLLYKMLTKKVPYESNQIVTVALMHKTAPIPVLPADLAVFQPVLNRLLAKAPENRFSSAQELIEALECIEPGFPLPEQGADQLANNRNPASHLSANPMDDLVLTSPTTPVDPSSGQMLEAALKNARGRSAGIEPEPAASRPGPPTPEPSRQASEVLPRGGWAVKKAGLLSGLTLISGLAFILFWMEPFSGSPLPSPSGAVSATGQGVSLGHHKVPMLSIPRPQETTPSSAKQSDRSSEGRKIGDQQSDRSSADRKISELLAKAHDQLARYHLTSPPGDNGYETYRQIMALDPSNQAAASLVPRIVEAYRRLALGAKSSGRLRKSLQYVDSGLKVRSEDPVLLALQTRLRERIYKKARIQLEQVKPVEQQKRGKAVVQAAPGKRRQADRKSTESTLSKPEERTEERQPVRLDRAKAVKKVNKQPKADTEQPQDNGKEAERKHFLFGTF